jgi:hypothetical protein
VLGGPWIGARIAGTPPADFPSKPPTTRNRGYVSARAGYLAAALAAASSREPLVIVDLAGLTFIDASGVAALARGRDHARGGGGELLLSAPQEQVRKMLAIIFPYGDFSSLRAWPPRPLSHGSCDCL